MKFFTTTLVAFLLMTGIRAQIADTSIPLKEVPVINMPRQNNVTLKEAELERRGPGIAPRFAVAMEVNISPFTHGVWEDLGNGLSVWRLPVQSTGAFSLNFGFSEYKMPSSGKLIFYPFNKKNVIGPFTAKDNETHGQLWTPVIQGEGVVIEVQIRTHEKQDLRLRLSAVNHDFLGFGASLSGSCNVDVLCGDADGFGIIDQYRDIIQSVAVFGTGGTTFCTGALINTTKNDCAPYFLTANHCMQGEDPAAIVVYWNYVNSFCRTPDSAASGAAGNGTLNDFNTGGTRKASYGPTDFYLLELDDPIPETANAFFAGWDKGEDLPEDSLIVVHHPRGHEKRISFEHGTPHLGEWGNGGTEVPTGNHVIIPDWDLGTTEGGSSGAPLFNMNKQIIGQLHGGSAACGNDAYDSFGWIAASWEGGGTSSSRLKDWLDPDDMGVSSLEGRDQIICSYYVIAEEGDITVCSPDDIVFTVEVSDSFEDAVTLSLDGLPENAVASFAENPVTPGMNTILTITNTGNIAEGMYDFEIFGTDGENTSNFNLQFSVVHDAPVILGMNPTNQEIDLPLNVILSWTDLGSEVVYDIQLANDDVFLDLLMDESGLGESMVISVLLEGEMTYYWRVRATNTCGLGEWTTGNSFSTGAISCGDLGMEGGPIIITEDASTTITSIITYPNSGTISEVAVLDLNIFHSWVGDLTVLLTSPEGTTITLFDQAGVPFDQYGCDGNDVQLSFSDNAPNSAEDLETTCFSEIALVGSFNPIDPFVSFSDENPLGNWTLTVIDALQFDGGSLENWNLSICTTIPSSAGVFPSVDNIESCEEEIFIFNVVVGTGFDGEVALTFSGLPNEAVIDVNPMSVEPGDNVMITISGVPQGVYNLEVMGTDGVQSDVQTVVVTSLASLPATNLLLPDDGVIDAPVGMTFSWNEVDGALSYLLMIAHDADFADVYFSTNTTGLTFDVTALDFGEKYYWRVIPAGDCGEGEASNGFSFTTIPDLATDITPKELSICRPDDVSVVITPGVGFEMPLSVVMQASSSIQPQVAYSVDPDDLTPGASFDVTITDFVNLVEPFIDVVFTISDGNYTQEVALNLTFTPTPSVAVLVTPENGASVFSQIIAFDWDALDGESTFLFELAEDEAFTAILVSENINTSSFDLNEVLEGSGAYFWRVTTINDCGQATTAPISFNQIVATHELEGRKVEVYPNPTSNEVNISFSIPFEEDLVLELFDITGRRLESKVIRQGISQQSINVQQYSDGIYLLKISGNKGIIVERIVIDK